MNYVKKYDVGEIKLDPRSTSGCDMLPFFVQYIHELPLLSLGDMQHYLNLSLVFNYENYRIEKENNTNPFFIAPGYKLNMQKCLLYDANGVPTRFVGENGETAGFNLSYTSLTMEPYSGVFTFDDESQRVLRKVERSQESSHLPEGNIDINAKDSVLEYFVEYPDFSKEKYDERGRITAAYDKYGNTIVTYTYNEYNQLTELAFRGSKVVSFTYEANRLKSIAYAGCTSSFNYNSDGTLNSLEHYTGVNYNFMLSESAPNAETEEESEEDFIETDYTIEAVSVENGTTVSYSKELKWANANTVEISDKNGEIVTNKVSYAFSTGLMFVESFSFVDITDNNGAVTRAQLEGRKVMYSYEVKNGEPQFVGEGAATQFVGNVTIYNSMSTFDSCQAAGVQTLQDGILMGYNSGKYEWQREIAEDVEKVSYYVVSGWIKSDDINTTSDTIHIEAGPVNATLGHRIDLKAPNQWIYFSIMSDMSANIVYVRNDNREHVSTRDVRITFPELGDVEGDNASHTNISEYVLINKNTGDEILLQDAELYYALGDLNYKIEKEDELEIEEENKNEKDIKNKSVTFSDIMRYKLRKKREGLKGELYYKNGVEAIVGITDLKVFYKDSYYSIGCFDLETRVYSNGKKYFTRISVDENNQSSDIVKTYTVEGTVVSTEKLNSNLDVVESIVEGVTTQYVRNSQGLVTSEIVSGLCTRTTVYDTNSANEPTITVTDEFNNSTVYTFDNVWGAVKSIRLPDDTVITNYYDGDMSTLFQKTFSSGGKERVHRYSYPDEQSLELSDDTLQYLFDNDFGVSGRQYVKKLGIPIETHRTSMTERTFEDAYPDYWMPEYTRSGSFDKYGRLTRIDGMLEYSYLIDPRWTYLHQNQQTHIMNEYNRVDDGELYHGSAGVDGKDGMLSQTKDLLTGKTTKYGYSKGKLTAALTYDNSDSVLSRELFVYDDAERLTKHNFNYNLSSSDPITGNHVGSNIVYVKSDDDPLADNRIASYSYKVGGAEKAKTENTYDAYKRVTNKKYTVGGKVFTKGIGYAQTIIGTVVDSVGGTTSYEYDAMGRIRQEKDGDGNVLKSYTYDEFGQLIREDNKTLDKTFVYEYNNIGNVTCVKEYDYFVTEEELPGCYRSIVYGYDAECPDKLTTFDGNVIEYNSAGCPSKYKDENYEWANGKLSKIHRSTFIRDEEHYTTRTFTYDGYGRRTQKHSVTGVNYFGADAVNSYSRSHTNDYTYDNNGRLIREVYTRRDSSGTVSETQELVYLYDESGMIGVMYNSQPYYYHRNLQGDVIAIYDANGEKQVEYAYDAWGNCEVICADTQWLAYANPIRYRGYYYDEDTKLYYLNARYYNPEWRRFISPDATEYIDPETPNGLNLYAYCNNDPVNYADPSGCFPVLACILGLTALFGMGLTIGGVVSDDNLMTAIGLTMVAIPALISGGLAAFATTGALATWIGIGTMVAGAGTGLFASAEYQETFSGNNWMLDAGMSEEWYTGLMIATAGLATLGTFASSFAYSFNIHSVNKVGTLEGTNYKGIRFTQKVKRASGQKVKLYRTLEWHTHSHMGYNPHWQMNLFSNNGGIWIRGKALNRWSWWLTKI